jgi:ApaG protein
MKKIKMSVVAHAVYLPEHSLIEHHRFFWSYEVMITNESDQVVQLLNRYWRITDMSGNREEVRGPGVIGLQPLIKAGKSFSYTSFCQLATPQGSMEGNYEMQTLDEERFIVEIPKFILTSPMFGSSGMRPLLH